MADYNLDSLNPLRIRECFRRIALMQELTVHVLIPYESGSVSDCTTIFIIN